MFKNGQLYPGSTIDLSLTLTDENGDAVDPATLTFRLMNPCGTTTDYVYGTDSEITKLETGVYLASVVPDQSGRWSFRWVATDPVFAKEDSFIVQASPFYDSCCRDYC